MMRIWRTNISRPRPTPNPSSSTSPVVEGSHAHYQGPPIRFSLEGNGRSSSTTMPRGATSDLLSHQAHQTAHPPARECPGPSQPPIIPRPRSPLPNLRELPRPASTTSRQCRATTPETAPEPRRTEIQASATDSMDMSSESCTSTPGSTDLVLPEEVEILETTLRVAYGITVEEANIPVCHWQPLLLKYVEGLHVYAQKALEGMSQPEDPEDSRSASVNQQYLYASGQPNNWTDSTRGVGKRSRDLAGNEEDGACGEGDGGNTRVGTAKRPKASHTPRLRLSCPYRKKDPVRFGVRQRYSCSMTYFDTFAKLR